MKIFPDFENLKINILDERFYQSPDNELIYYPGATTILQEHSKGRGYEEWLMKAGLNAKEISRKAMERGSRVHGAIEQFCKGEIISPIDENGNLKGFIGFDEWEMVCKFHRWYEMYQPEIVATELVLVSDNLQFGGTLDLICRIPTGEDATNQTWLIDYKTGGEYLSHKLQLAAYKKLAEDKGIQIDRVGIMYLEALTRTEKFMQGKGWKVDEITSDIEDYWEDFKAPHHTWKRKNPNYIPKNKIYPMELSIEQTQKLLELKKEN